MRFTVDALGVTNAFGYDSVGRRIAVTNALGTASAMTNYSAYDAAGNMPLVTNALGRVTTNVYDVLNRLSEVRHPDGTTNRMTYDILGRRVLDVDAAGIQTGYGYDALGRLTSLTNDLGGAQQAVTCYEYDEAGNQTAQVDALGRVTRYEHDELGRRTKRTLPGGQVETYGYDAIGNLVRLTNFAGIVLTNSYDVMNRLTNRSAMGLVLAAFTYTASGERATMSDPSGTSAWQYDARGRLVTNTTPQGTLHYRYDAAGRLTNLWSATTDGVDLVYSHDALGRITNAVEQGGAVLSAGYGFDGLGSLRTVTYGNGVTNLYQYDGMQRLTNALWKNGGTTLGSFAYALGKTGNRTNLSEAVNGVSGTFNWQYDRRYRLTNEVLTGGSSGALAYKYDPVGNRTNRTSSVSGLGNQTHSFNTNDWLTADSYDASGNTTNSAGNTYRYDPLNRLTNAIIGGTNIMIVYDGDGNRVRKTVNGAVTLYLVDNRNPTGYAQVVEEKTVSGGVTNLSRVYALGLDLFAQRTIGGSSHYFGYDGHGSTRFLTDTSAAVANTYRYDAYGNLIASTGTTPNAYRYTGEQWDADLGMYYLRARYLNPDTGRFWTMDSYEGSTQDPLSLHKYLYAHGNPVMMVDPSGHFSIVTLTVNAAIKGSIAAVSFGAVNGAFTYAKTRSLEAAMFSAGQTAAITYMAFVSPAAAISLGIGGAGAIGLGVYNGDITAQDTPELAAYAAVGIGLSIAFRNPAFLEFEAATTVSAETAMAAGGANAARMMQIVGKLKNWDWSTPKDKAVSTLDVGMTRQLRRMRRTTEHSPLRKRLADGRFWRMPIFWR